MRTAAAAAVAAAAAAATAAAAAALELRSETSQARHTGLAGRKLLGGEVVQEESAALLP